MLGVRAEMAKNLRSIRQDAPQSQLKARSDCFSDQSWSPPEFVHVLMMTWLLARTIEVFVKLKKPFERKSWHAAILLLRARRQLNRTQRWRTCFTRGVGATLCFERTSVAVAFKWQISKRVVGANLPDRGEQFAGRTHVDVAFLVEREVAS